MDDATLVCHLRTARRKALCVAVAEVMTLLEPFGAREMDGGPLSERGGVFWIGLPASGIESATLLLPRLGYTTQVDRVEVLTEGQRSTGREKDPDRVRWRNRTCRLVRLYEEDEEAARENAPDRRTFLLETGDGVVRAVQGYRGDGAPLSRRGLPVCDARALVNLSGARAGDRFLDPFGGIGGIVREAIVAGCQVSSVDCDPALRHGLAAFGSAHLVGDASLLPYPDQSFEAIATEPPYHQEAQGSVLGALHEMARVLIPGGRISMLVARWQSAGLKERAASHGLVLTLESPIDRKGLETTMIVWKRAGK